MIFVSAEFLDCTNQNGNMPLNCSNIWLITAQIICLLLVEYGLCLSRSGKLDRYLQFSFSRFCCHENNCTYIALCNLYKITQIDLMWAEKFTHQHCCNVLMLNHQVPQRDEPSSNLDGFVLILLFRGSWLFSSWNTWSWQISITIRISAGSTKTLNSIP